MAPGSVSEPATGHAVVLPCPFRRRDVGFVEDILGRIAGLDDDGPVLRQQQHHAHFQHQRGLVGRRPQHVVEGADPGQLAAEGVEQFDVANAVVRRHGLRAHARGNVGHHDGHDGEEHEGGDVGRIGDGEGVERRQEEEIVAQATRPRGKQRRPKPIANGDADHRGQEDEVDILDAEEGLDRARRRRGRRQRRPARPNKARGRKAPRLPPHAPSSWGSGRAASLVAGDHMNADIAGAPNEVVNHRAVQDLEPSRTRRLADDDLRDIVGLRETDNVVGDAGARRREW